MFFIVLCSHINPAKICPKKITKNDKKIANNLNYDGIEFPVRKKFFCKIEKRNNICMKTNSLFQFTFQIKNLKTQ